ncbi:hypothetical protein WOLCODRAFT_22670 [Wolfiporia cocos MD-104 SS10]|uniref:Uncharacterized protein n=1 Tax=Wolfiporia cocos (strain MD-104) TaxID=742152 RepID=A0A2H3IXE5_WOLCO|nr:hypothetical protein WOLCODRAFT_22670 [Wolfiporia cocos MD-104 SS10]
MPVTVTACQQGIAQRRLYLTGHRWAFNCLECGYLVQYIKVQDPSTSCRRKRSA